MLQEEPELYPAVQHIWEWFIELNNTSGGGFGPAPITHQEIRAWRLEMQIKPRPTPWEIRQIKLIDRISRKVQAEKDKAERDKKP